MKRLKTFETFDFSQTLPVASKSDLTNYYHCDDCDGLWKEFNRQSRICKSCNSTSIEELSSDEWYQTKGINLDDNDLEDLNSEKKSDSENFVNLYDIDSESSDFSENVKNGKSIKSVFNNLKFSI